MSTKTGIEWTDATWNPVRGCTRVSEGCRNCYAEGVAYRFSGPGQPYEGLVQVNAQRERKRQWSGVIQFVEKHLLDPLRWKTPRRIFVNSMSDLFHEGVTDEMRDRIFAVMALSPQHTFQVLTKRPERMLAYFDPQDCGGRLRVARLRIRDYAVKMQHLSKSAFDPYSQWPLPNVWLGVSVENRKAKPRIDALRATPAALRFLSLEPLLEDLGELDLTGIDWVIVGGESGKGAGIRPMHPDWVRSVRDQCAAAGVPFFFKQWGEWGVTGRERHLFAPKDSGAMLGMTTVFCTDMKYRGEHTFAALPAIPDSLARVSGDSGWVEFERMRRVGKKAAGDLLDGVRHHAFPEVR